MPCASAGRLQGAGNSANMATLVVAGAIVAAREVIRAHQTNYSVIKSSDRVLQALQASAEDFMPNLAPISLQDPVPATAGENKKIKTCKVCHETFDDDLHTVVAFFCGHVTCHKCAYIQSRCYTCKHPISRRIKLFT
mmetsp:Transcript_6247/g.11109  ORF Transcript_6247/g.11109 Transcript_6247/m.11109 type:complete len:137 (+) Transcript_6247:276-686(+)